LHSGLQVSWGCQVLGGQSLERGQKGDNQVFKKLIGVLWIYVTLSVNANEKELFNGRGSFCKEA